MSALSPLRDGRVTGSRIAAILGLSPYDTRESILRQMVRQTLGAPDEFVTNPAVEWGTAHELDGVAAYELRNAVMVHGAQDIVLDPMLPLAVTPDGLVGDVGMIEVKCPWRATYTGIDERPDYEAQCRLALHVTGRQWCDFVVWRPDSLAVTRVVQDVEWLPTVWPQVEAFLAEYQAAVADPGLAEPHLMPLRDVRTDEPWALAAVEYAEAKLAADYAAKHMDMARERLIGLADGRPAKGHGVTVSRAGKRVSVSYAKALKELAPDADLGPYTTTRSVPPTVRTHIEKAAR